MAGFSSFTHITSAFYIRFLVLRGYFDISFQHLFLVGLVKSWCSVSFQACNDTMYIISISLFFPMSLSVPWSKSIYSILLQEEW